MSFDIQIQSLIWKVPLRFQNLSFRRVLFPELKTWGIWWFGGLGLKFKPHLLRVELDLHPPASTTTSLLTKVFFILCYSTSGGLLPIKNLSTDTANFFLSFIAFDLTNDFSASAFDNLSFYIKMIIEQFSHCIKT